MRVGGEDRRIHRLGKWSDPSAVARAQALSAQIWSDWCSGRLDPTLERYQPVPAEQGKSPLLEALKALMESKRQGRVTHAYRVFKRYGGGLSSGEEVSGFLRWMESEGLAASTGLSILSTIRSVQPGNEALAAAVIKVPSRSVQEEVLSKGEIQKVLADLQVNEGWFYPVFAVCPSWAVTPRPRQPHTPLSAEQPGGTTHLGSHPGFQGAHLVAPVLSWCDTAITC